MANSPTNVTFVDYVTPVTATWLNFVNNAVQGLAGSVLSFGADPTGATDSTLAFQKALNAGGSVYIPNGTYQISSITVPVGCNSMLGQSRSGVIFVPATGRSSGTPLITLNATSRGQYGNFTIQATSALTDSPIFITNDNYSDLSFVTITNCGGIGIQTNTCTGTRIFSNSVLDNGTCAIFNGASNYVEIFGNECYSVSSDTNSTIGTQNGTNNSIYDNYCKRTTASIGFCIGVQFESYTTVKNNTVLPNTLEGIATTDSSHISILDNTVYCQTGHHDFGITIDATAANALSCVVANNHIENSGKAGVDLTSTSSSAYCLGCTIQGNHVLDPCQNQLAGEPHAAFIVTQGTGINATQNTVQNNTVVDFTNQVHYICYENNGTANIFKDNSPVVNTAILTTENISSGTTSRFWDMLQNIYSVNVVAASGTLGGFTSTGLYSRRGQFIDLFITVNISNAGSGTNALDISLPFACTGALSGRETTTGGSISGSANNSTAIFTTFYNGGYPGVTGYNLVLSGTLELT